MSVGTVYDGFAKLLKVVGHLVKWKRLRDDPQLPMTILLRASQYASFPAELAQVLETKMRTDEIVSILLFYPFLMF
jgi:hypothetical protein